jgi:acetylornithine deacetylase/succinyl-diaminopimelate desuccinylase-like protein
MNVTLAFSAPDEFYRLANYELGQRAYCRLIEELGQAQPGT